MAFKLQLSLHQVGWADLITSSAPLSMFPLCPFPVPPFPLAIFPQVKGGHTCHPHPPWPCLCCIWEQVAWGKMAFKLQLSLQLVGWADLITSSAPLSMCLPLVHVSPLSFSSSLFPPC